MKEKDKLDYITEGQLSFAENGNIKPCPYKDGCPNHPAGCKGESYWCKRHDKKEDFRNDK